ncbi:MAG: formate dehydrogenase accessory sulfurtransferase FdhD [Syntrophotaleaceae bacterium]
MEILDLRGVACPMNFIKIKLALEMLDDGETVEILLDDGEPVKNVPQSLKAEGHRLLGLNRKDDHYVLTVENNPRPEAGEGSIRNYNSTKITREGAEPATDPVMVEETVDLIVNGTRLASIVTTPDLHRELAVGYLVTEGAVKNGQGIQSIEEKANCVLLEIRSFEHFDHWHELRSSGWEINWDRPDEDVTVPLQQTFRIEVLLDSMRHLYDVTQDKTGGAHTASLVAADGTLKYKAVDIGRHNAIDKVVGMAVLNGDDLSQMFLVSSGRQPAGMVMKAARAGLPLIISKSAPISSGIDAARRSNVTLCCYATFEKTKVFSVPERISFDSVKDSFES